MTDLTDLGELGERDADRLELLDRIKQRVPELDLAQQSVEWTTLDDGHEALFVNLDATTGHGDGAYFANYGDDVHAIGSMAPLFPVIGCVVIKPDGTATSPAWRPTRRRSRTRSPGGPPRPPQLVA
jgi:hypothetical protein